MYLNIYSFGSSNCSSYSSGSITVKVEPSCRYKFSAWVRNSNKAVKSKIRVVCGDENMLLVKNISSILIGKTGWIEVTIETWIPQNTIRMGFGLSSSGNEGTTWFDCLTLKCLSQ